MSRPKPPAFIYIGASLPQVAGIRTIREMGLYMVVTDVSPEAPGRRIADRFEAISATDIQAQVALADEVARTHDVVGCYGVADYASPAIAAIYNHLTSLPDREPSTAASVQKGLASALRVAADKAETTACWRRAGLPVPRQLWASRTVNPEADAHAVTRTITSAAIVKPVGGNNSRGITLISAPEQTFVIRALRVALACGEGVVVEQYCDGRLVNVDGLMIDGCIHCVSITDRTSMYGGGFQPRAAIRPTDLPAEQAAALYDLAGRAANAIGLRDGPFTVDLILGPEGPFLLELTPNFHSVFSEGLAANGWAVRTWLAYLQGDEAWPSLLEEPSEKAVGYVQFYAERPGVVTRIRGLGAVSNDPNFADFYSLRNVGERVHDDNGFHDVCGVAWFTASSRQVLQDTMNRATETLIFETACS